MCSLTVSFTFCCVTNHTRRSALNIYSLWAFLARERSAGLGGPGNLVDMAGTSAGVAGTAEAFLHADCHLLLDSGQATSGSRSRCSSRLLLPDVCHRPVGQSSSWDGDPPLSHYRRLLRVAFPGHRCREGGVHAHHNHLPPFVLIPRDKNTSGHNLPPHVVLSSLKTGTRSGSPESSIATSWSVNSY